MILELEIIQIYGESKYKNEECELRIPYTFFLLIFIVQYCMMITTVHFLGHYKN